MKSLAKNWIFFCLTAPLLLSCLGPASGASELGSSSLASNGVSSESSCPQSGTGSSFESQEESSEENFGDPLEFTNVSSMKRGAAQEGSHAEVRTLPSQSTLIASDEGMARFSEDYPDFYDAMIAGREPKALMEFDYLVLLVHDSSTFFWWRATGVFFKGSRLSVKYSGEFYYGQSGECLIDQDYIPIYMVVALEKPSTVPTSLVSLNYTYYNMSGRCGRSFRVYESQPEAIALYS